MIQKGSRVSPEPRRAALMAKDHAAEGSGERGHIDVLQGVGPSGFIHGQHVRDQEAAACEKQPAGDDAGQQPQHGGLVQPVLRLG